MYFLILLHFLVHPNPIAALRGGRFLTLDGLYNAWNVLSDQALDATLESVGLEEKCPYVTDMGSVLRQRLPDVIKGQPRAIGMISDAVAAWEYRKVYLGRSDPLVLALAGDTGTGKSETALRLAELVLQKKDLLSLTDYRVNSPRGFMVLRGEEYSVATYSGRDGPAHVQQLLTKRITDHLQKCGGNGVILVDEVQKFVNGSIELFLSGISDKMGDLAATHWLTGAPIRVSTRNLIVILATDIGHDSIRQLLMENYGDADAIPQQKLRTALTKRFDAYWSSKLLTSVVTETVPFFPLGRAELREVLKLQLREMALKELDRGSLADLVYDSHLLSYLTSHKYIHYLKYSNIDESSSIIVAEKGGRSITKKGPLLTLQSLIVRYMQPWHSEWIMHIGVEPSFSADGNSNEKKLKILGAAGADEKKRPLLYLQWCRVTPRQESETGASYARVSVNARQEDKNSPTDAAESTCADDSENMREGGPHFIDDKNAVVADGVVNSRVGLFYSLNDLDVFSTNACETKWIGHLESSLNN